MFGVSQNERSKIYLNTSNIADSLDYGWLHIASGWLTLETHPHHINEIKRILTQFFSYVSWRLMQCDLCTLPLIETDSSSWREDRIIFPLRIASLTLHWVQSDWGRHLQQVMYLSANQWQNHQIWQAIPFACYVYTTPSIAVLVQKHGEALSFHLILRCSKRAACLLPSSIATWGCLVKQIAPSFLVYECPITPSLGYASVA